MMRAFLCAAAILILYAPGAHSRVVGWQGVTYPIKERDMLEIIQERAAKVDMQALEARLQEEIRKQAENFRPKDAVSGLPPARESRQYRVDLTYTVPQDITDVKGNIVYPVGHKVNPLKVMADQGLHYPFLLLVINGERREEVEWFIDSEFNNPRVKLLITDGYPYKLAETVQRPVFQLSKLIKDRFVIRETPSLVLWPLESDYLAVRTIVVPDDAVADDKEQTPQGTQAAGHAQ